MSWSLELFWELESDDDIHDKASILCPSNFLRTLEAILHSFPSSSSSSQRMGQVDAK
jgi:hypothetical protein